MSDTNNQNSILTNLKNKIKYNIFNATYDPDANNFAQQQQEKELANQQESTSPPEVESTDTDDPNKFSIKRVVKKVGNQTWQAIQSGFIPFLALMLAMIVTNEMIVYSVPIRIIFFIFVLLVCIFVPFFAIVLGVIYLLKGGYSYYYNNMTDRPTKHIMPTIFALLPITTKQATSPLGRFVMYPFTYPKTEKGALALPEIIKEYWLALQASFKDIDKVKNLPIFTDGLKRAEQELMNLNKLPIIEENSAQNSLK